METTNARIALQTGKLRWVGISPLLKIMNLFALGILTWLVFSPEGPTKGTFSYLGMVIMAPALLTATLVGVIRLGEKFDIGFIVRLHLFATTRSFVPAIRASLDTVWAAYFIAPLVEHCYVGDDEKVISKEKQEEIVKTIGTINSFILKDAAETLLAFTSARVSKGSIPMFAAIMFVLMLAVGWFVELSPEYYRYMGAGVLGAFIVYVIGFQRITFTKAFSTPTSLGNILVMASLGEHLLGDKTGVAKKTLFGALLKGAIFMEDDIKNTGSQGVTFVTARLMNPTFPISSQVYPILARRNFGEPSIEDLRTKHAVWNLSADMGSIRDLPVFERSGALLNNISTHFLPALTELKKLPRMEIYNRIQKIEESFKEELAEVEKMIKSDKVKQL